MQKGILGVFSLSFNTSEKVQLTNLLRKDLSLVVLYYICNVRYTQQMFHSCVYVQ